MPFSQTLQQYGFFLNNDAIQLNLFPQVRSIDPKLKNVLQEKLFCGQSGVTISKISEPTVGTFKKSVTYPLLHKPSFYVLLWIMIHFSVTRRGMQILCSYYGTQHARIHYMHFMGLYVAVLTNTMAHLFVEALMIVMEKKTRMTKTGMKRVIKKKWTHLYRMVFGEMFLKTLTEYGRYPDASKQPRVKEAIDGKHGLESILASRAGKSDDSGTKAIGGIDGMTQVIFYYWPMLMHDTERLLKAIEEKANDPSYMVTFLHYMGDTRDFAVLKKRKQIKRIEDQICLFVPEYLDLPMQFPKYIDGTNSLSEFLSENVAHNGVDQGKEQESGMEVNSKEMDADVNVSITASTATPVKVKKKNRNLLRASLVKTS